MKEMILSAALLIASWGCVVDMRDKDRGSADTTDVSGTYFAADSGTTLGKHWCYSGALVLDSTRHFGSVITMCDDAGSPQTERLNGTYDVRAVNVHVKGQRHRVRRLDVLLHHNGPNPKTHTLVYNAGTLRFDEPWWLGAGLRALEIPDPTLRKIDASSIPDSSPATAASSTAPLRASSRFKTNASRPPAKATK